MIGKALTPMTWRAPVAYVCRKHQAFGGAPIKPNVEFKVAQQREYRPWHCVQADTATSAQALPLCG